MGVTDGQSATSSHHVRPVMPVHGERGARETLSSRRQRGGDGCQFGHRDSVYPFWVNYNLVFDSDPPLWGPSESVIVSRADVH